jgi:hypothetical protein
MDKKLTSRIAAVATAAALGAGAVALVGAPAWAAQHDMKSCTAGFSGACHSGTVEPNSTGHWVQSRVRCGVFSASYQVIDINTSAVVARGSCSPWQNSPWITTPGLYNTWGGGYYISVRSGGNYGGANGDIRNYS